jgi:hypothetical protein
MLFTILAIIKILERDPAVLPIVGIKSDYLPLPKNQGQEGLCWAFAAAAHLEIEYAVLTGNRMKLSVEQVDNNVVEFYNSLYDIITHRKNPIFGTCHSAIGEDYVPTNGGSIPCALMYYLDAGAMLEYDYPYNNGNSTSKYNIDKTTTLNIDEIEWMLIQNTTLLYYNTTSYHENDNIIPIGTKGLYEFVYNILASNHSIAVAINAGGAFNDYGVAFDKDEVNDTTHGVVLTAFVHIDASGDIYAEVFNSWGETMVGGLYYIKVYDAAKNEYWNNRKIFTDMAIATVSSGVHKKSINFIGLTIQFISFTINFVIVVYILRLHFNCFKKAFDCCCCCCRCLYCGFCNNKLYREEQEESTSEEGKRIKESLYTP